MRSLRRGTPLLLLPPVLPHYLHSVLLTIAAALRLGLNLLIQLLIFLNLQEFADVVCQKTNRVALALPRRLHELFPELLIEFDFSFHIESPLWLIVLLSLRIRNHSCSPRPGVYTDVCPRTNSSACLRNAWLANCIASLMASKLTL